jgi:small-conductance mechanosensitive channel
MEVGITLLRPGNGLELLAAGVAKYVFGPGAVAPVWRDFSWTDILSVPAVVLLVLIVNFIAAFFVRRALRTTATLRSSSRRDIVTAFAKPFYLLVALCGTYPALSPLIGKLLSPEGVRGTGEIVDRIFGVGGFFVLFWLVFRLTRVLEKRLSSLAAKTTNKLDDLFVPLLGKSLRVIVPVVGLIFCLPILGLPSEWTGIVAKGTTILLIVAISVIMAQAVGIGEKAVLAEYDIGAADNLRARKLYTQAHVISRTLYVIIVLFAAASILMLFDEVRRLGTSILASAGVVGVILGFAAQKTISNLFAGFQLALTQPIRLDDVVIVEGEWGRIQEITLTYVVLHIWDDRRLIVPLGYFIEKPFQNWTRASADLLGSVFFWMDYSLPLDEARKALEEIIGKSPLWDGRFWNLQVTDTNEKAMQVRVLATSADSSKSWDLRCEIREKFISYVRQNHPSRLPKLRAEIAGPQPHGS